MLPLCVSVVPSNTAMVAVPIVVAPFLSVNVTFPGPPAFLNVNGTLRLAPGSWGLVGQVGVRLITLGNARTTTLSVGLVPPRSWYWVTCHAF